MIPDNEVVTHKSLRDIYIRLDAILSRLNRVEAILLANRNALLENKEVQANPEVESTLRWAFIELNIMHKEGKE